MKRSPHKRLDELSAKTKARDDLLHYFNAVIYIEEDPKIAHTYGPRGEIISVPRKKLDKALRKAFNLSKKDNMYIVISQFPKRRLPTDKVNDEDTPQR